MRSAGLLPYRNHSDLEVLVAHPGGPYYARKDAGYWSVVKGMVKPGENDREAAIREFTEETGWAPPTESWVSLGTTVLRSGKVVVTWAIEHEFDMDSFNPGTFRLHGREYPEIDRVDWVSVTQARVLLPVAQTVFIDRLELHLGLNEGSKEYR